MSQTEEQPKKKQPKITDDIKALLKDFTNLRDRIDKKEKRLACLELSMGAPSTPNLTGMPGGGGDGSSKIERNYIKKEEIEEQLRDMYAEENRRREEIEDMFERIEDPAQQSVVEMRYIDEAQWGDVCVALFGNEPDYDERERHYHKKTFKIHGAALLTLARIYAAKRG